VEVGERRDGVELLRRLAAAFPELFALETA